MRNCQELSARELLWRVYGALRRGKNKIKLPSKAKAEVARDSDYHKTRVGYTSYESAALLKAGDQEWALAFGVKCGSYPADPFNCDIAAIQISSKGKSKEKLSLEIYEKLEKNKYFHHSLIFAMANGQLSTAKNGRFGQKISNLLESKIQKFIAQELKIDSRCLEMDLCPLVTSPVRYKPGTVRLLCNTLRTILES